MHWVDFFFKQINVVDGCIEIWKKEDWGRLLEGAVCSLISFVPHSAGYQWRNRQHHHKSRLACWRIAMSTTSKFILVADSYSLSNSCCCRCFHLWELVQRQTLHEFRLVTCLVFANWCPDIWLIFRSAGSLPSLSDCTSWSTSSVRWPVNQFWTLCQQRISPSSMIISFMISSLASWIKFRWGVD
jgi:hypothetical protein